MDLIYADPPFNTGKDWGAFDDRWSARNPHGPPVAPEIVKAARLHSLGMAHYIAHMAARLLAMRRLLKPTGSIYLHCDPTASHYLKMLMDVVFGVRNFRNEVVWKRSTGHPDAKRFGSISDRILFYVRTGDYLFNRVRVPHSQSYIKSKFRHQDKRGRFRLSDLNPPAGRGPVYEFHGVTRPWVLTEEKMRALDHEGRIYSKSKIPQLKRYLNELPDQAVADIWTDVSPINSQAKERLGYPTQKPLALLDRIIRASSNPGDLVLDPFCGSGTTLEAAHKLGRRWIGIDIGEEAIRISTERMARALAP